MAVDRVKIPMDLNVPVTMRVQYVTVWPNDPTKNGGKCYGSSVSLQGTALVNGEWVPAQTYAKGKTWAALKALTAAGVITQNEKAWDDPSERVAVPVNTDLGAVTMVYSKRHGDAYATFTVERRDGMPAESHATHPTPSGPAMGEFEGDPLENYQPAHSKADDANALVTGYRKLYESNARWLDKLAKELEFPIDGASVNAVTFSMFSTLRDRKLV